MTHILGATGGLGLTLLPAQRKSGGCGWSFKSGLDVADGNAPQNDYFATCLLNSVDQEGEDRERKKEKLIKNDRNTICTIPVPQFKLQLQNGKSLFLTKVQSQDPITYHKYNTVYYCINTSTVRVIPMVLILAPSHQFEHFDPQTVFGDQVWFDTTK